MENTVFKGNMLKQAIGITCKTRAYAFEGNRVLPWVYVPSCFFRSGQVKSLILPFKVQFKLFLLFSIFFSRISFLSV